MQSTYTQVLSVLFINLSFVVGITVILLFVIKVRHSISCNINIGNLEVKLWLKCLSFTSKPHITTCLICLAKQVLIFLVIKVPNVCQSVLKVQGSY